MFNSLKKLFGRRVETTVEPREHRKPVASGLTLAPGFTPRTVRPQAAAPVPRATGPVPATLSIPLKAIMSRLPADLMQRVRQKEVGEVEIPISMQKVLSQIGQGAVKISFGELRQLSPQGTFTSDTDQDRTLVDLPLHEVLARMNLALLPRRSSQKQVEVPPEVTGPFGGQCKVAISTAPLKPVPQAQQPAPRPPAPPPRNPPPPIPPPTATPTVLNPSISIPPVQRPQPLIARLRNGSTSADPTPAPSAPEMKEPDPKPIFSRIDRATSVTPPAPAAPTSFVAPFAPRPVVTPIAPESKPVAPIAMPPVAPAAPITPIAMPPVARFTPPPAPPAPVAVTPVTPIAPAPEPEPAPIRFTAPTPVPAPAPVPVAPTPEVLAAGETRFLTVSLSELAIVWPDAIKDQIVLLNATSSSIGLPMGLIETALKTGKIAFTWKTLRSWIKPPIPATASAQDAMMLDLPLRVIAPLFLGEMKGIKAQNRVSVDEEIPDLFFDGTSEAPAAATAPAPATASRPAPAVRPAPIAAAPAPRPVATAPVVPSPTPIVPVAANAPAASAKNSITGDTNFFSRRDDVDADEVAEEDKPIFLKKDGTPGTAFLKRYATPNEIVNKAASLAGVDGALIALPDGLLVACKMPPTMNADTVAAFLPQIFTKVSQCTRELRLGDLNNLNFTVGNVPWKIFKVGAIYFAAFGRPGEAMPTAQLAKLAVELDHKGK